MRNLEGRKIGEGVIERYRSFLPVTEATPVISLAEGSTPLIFSPRLSEETGCEVYLKFEGMNPTGSFKDRGMTVAMSKAAEAGANLIICASTGNTSASAAAYAARAGIRCAVLLPAGKIAMGKLAQAFVYGATVVAVDGNFDDCLKLVRDLSSEPGVAVVNSINPFRIEGQKTASFEIIDRLGDAPDYHFLPVGNAGNITACWKGYCEYKKSATHRPPRMIGFQAAGAAPIYYDKIVDNPQTAATAIRIGNPASWKGALDAVRESEGKIGIVTDDEIFTAQRWLASSEGVFVEPASAASVAGLLKLRTDVAKGSVIVCTVTGHGLKDVTAVKEMQPVGAPAKVDVILKILSEASR
jgi:threonine synthase